MAIFEGHDGQSQINLLPKWFIIFHLHLDVPEIAGVPYPETKKLPWGLNGRVRSRKEFDQNKLDSF